MITVKTCAAPGCDLPLPAGRRRFCSDDCRRAGRRAERVREPDEFAAMTRRMVRALARRAGDADPAQFREVWAMLAEAEAAVTASVDSLRAKGFSWAEIAAEVGVTRQGMSQWRKRRPGGDAVND
jgi:hypothetical protein